MAEARADTRTTSILANPHALGVSMVLAFTFIRISALFATPLELYPDEAQYWLWSQTPALGYVSKPPMIAWLIRATTLFGDSEAWIRLSAPLCHAVAALALQRAGGRLYGAWAGLWAALIYSLMPGVQLSSAVIATDAPLLACLGLAIWAYAVWWTARSPAERRWAAAAMGAALGVAALAKYAAVYVMLGVALHAVISVEARRRWRAGDLLAVAGLLALVLAPNLIWNGLHNFATLSHTAQSADWNQPTEIAAPTSGFDPRQAPGFFVSQFGVFGPIAFAVFLWAAGEVAWRRLSGAPANPRAAADGLCLSLALPALLIVLVEAGLARANANWAAAAYAPGSVVVAGWLVRQPPGLGRPLRVSLAASQALLTLAFLVFLVRPDLADRAGFSNSLKRARGWAETARVTFARAAAEPGLSAVAADDRFLYNSLAYYGRAELARPGAPPLKMWVRESRPLNEAEATAPLTPAQGGRVLVAAITYPDEAAADFRAITGRRVLDVALDAARLRRLELFVGEGFAPLPRDPVTGLPPRPRAATQP